MMLTKEMFLSEVKNYLDGHSPFLAVRRFVFQYFEAEEDFELTEELDGILEVFLPYVHHEEAVGDPDCGTRLRRLYDVLGETTTFPKERTVFAIEFEKLRDLTKKVRNGVISNSVYQDQISKFSSCSFDYDVVKSWAASHADEQEPILAKMSVRFDCLVPMSYDVDCD